jgi:CxxC-x17-CxxC domain-containing protein
MPDFKKNNKFSRPSFNKGPGARPSYGPSRGPRQFGGRDDGPKEMFEAACSNCGNKCEVPFRPNGKKPVYCRDCFVRDDAQDSRSARPAYPKKEFGPKREFDRPAHAAHPPRHEEHSMRDITRELESLNLKLDKLVRVMESSMMKPAAPAKVSSEEPVTLAKALTKATAKKPVKKVAKPAKKK